jgi:hypothetical protein
MAAIDYGSQYVAAGLQDGSASVCSVGGPNSIAVEMRVSQGEISL